ncbi:MAG: hypothetical protein IJ777_00540 [Clostridia bacterium]|nr:hypothetical protein [Clostridia bacterium]
MQERKRSKAKKLSVSKLILFSIITTMIVTVLTSSRYESSTASSDNAKVAVPVINLSSNTLDLSINPNTDEKEYVFKVTNTEDEKQTEVTMEYAIQIKSLGNLPLEFELYQYEDGVLGNTNLLSGNGSITNFIKMGLNEKIEHTYMLKIKWRQTEKSYQYNKTIDYVQVVLDSKQVD